jgi:hypothetical protein
MSTDRVAEIDLELRTEALLAAGCFDAINADAAEKHQQAIDDLLDERLDLTKTGQAQR